MVRVLLLMTCLYAEYALAIDTLRANQSIHDSEFLLSKGLNFKLEFFSPVNSSYRYVGVMYNIPVLTVIWVANRDKPLNDSNGSVEISEDGNLVILDAEKGVVWSSNLSNSVNNRSAVILDTGNLVLQDSSSGATVWESFRHASDSFMQSMKILTDLSTNERNVLTSWRSPDDPAVGSFTASIEPLELPQIVVRNGSDPVWRSGPWNNQVFIGVSGMATLLYRNGFDMVNDAPSRTYLTFTYWNTSVSTYFVLNASGTLQEKVWSDEEGDWKVEWSSIETECDVYGKCGPFGICDAQARPVCSCLRGFEPKDINEWNAANWSSGCTRKTPLECGKNNSVGEKDGFLRVETVKLPDHFTWYPSLEEDCGNNCLNTCSCVAYAYYSGIGCMLWNETLIDVQKFSSGHADLYIRLPHSELAKRKGKKTIIATTIVAGSITIVCTLFIVLKRYIGSKKRRHLRYSEEMVPEDNMNGVKVEELPLFTFKELSTATRNFDSTHKLGQGGFGPVYKGTLPNGQEIAVKRLSRSSDQGVEEFKNEVEVISKLQHRNLVRLLGCCVELDEKMLVYEYLPNKSLDAYIFNSHKRECLDWDERMFIVKGICRGLLYLHQDSRLRIIHRDLKASNILLDEELNPKISDFGMARIFGGKEDQANTIRVVGTLGYMAPEYALQGRFSEKSDVFSFGVLLLEIVSGRRNNSFYNDDQAQSLTAYAWKVWSEGNIMELVKPSMHKPQSEGDIKRCVHVGLLCVQEIAEDRPNISTVLSMLSSETLVLPLPNRPAFTVIRRRSIELSVNEVSVTVFEGR